MFLDEARIFVQGGEGGDGIVHFRREKYVPRGGPDGGDGGRGGDVILAVSPTLNTLSPLRHQSHYRAEDGGNGGPSKRTGKSGQDLMIQVPPGTVVRDEESEELLGDLVDADHRLVVAKGGRPGRGNARFATSRNRAPRMAEKGEPGQERWISLELRLLADVGIIGLPNAGKSTFLAAVSNAKPKIGAYPFTTLQPNLGVVDLDHEKSLVLADIPGLIEGAHEGAGLGTGFLRHIQRTRVLIHLLDGSSPDPLADFSQINSELALFDEDLERKPQVIALNKIDLPDVEARVADLQADFAALGHKIYPISALARQNLRQVLYAANEALEETPATAQEQDEEELPVYRPAPDPKDFRLKRDPDGAWRVVGEAVERAAARTYWEYDEAVRRFQRLLSNLGVEQALKDAGAQEGDTVRIGEAELEWRE
jgi:GTP-binding protein